MKIKSLFILFFLFSVSIIAQAKVSGIVVDENNEPIPFANVYFKNSTEGVITNENGRFYLESPKSYGILVLSFIGYTAQDIKLEKAVTYNMKVTLTEGETLREVVLISGKLSKKIILQSTSFVKFGKEKEKMDCGNSINTNMINMKKLNLI